MSKHCLIPLIIIMSLVGIKAFAFDPYTTMTMANTAVGMFNSMKGAVDTIGDLSEFAGVIGETSETIGEASELASDLGLEGDSEQVNKQLSKMEKLNESLKDIRWTSEDLKYSLDSDIKSTKSFASKIKQMRKILSTSKKLAGIFGLKTKGSEKVAALQQVKIDSLILDEVQAIRKIQLLAYLEDKERIVKQDIYLNQLITEEQKKSFRGKKL